MTIRCDGCERDWPSGEMAFPSADGHEARYCPACHAIYEDFVKAILAREDALNAAHRLWCDDLRRRVALRYMPQDAPPIVRRNVADRPLVLG